MLLLYELLGPDPFRHHRNESFPFMLGLCRMLGLPARWRTAFVRPRGEPGERFLIDLDERERRDLSEAIEEVGARTVILNESLAPDLSFHLGRRHPDVSFKSVGDLSVPEQVRLHEGPVSALAAFLGVGPEAPRGLNPEATTIEEIEPSFSREVDGSSPTPDLVFLRVLLGAECAYRRPLRENPHYADIDLSSASHDRGCSFCNAGSSAERSKALSLPPLDLAFRQIEAAARDVTKDPSLEALHRTADGRLMFLVQGAVAFQRLEGFLDRLIASPRPPSAFLFSCRADELLARAPVLERFLPLLEPHGHAVCIWVMGIENFSRDENERLNKGIEPEQVVAAEELMKRLETEHPGSFQFERYGGFSFILFTPWTTLSDLGTNLHWARRASISPRGFFLRSRAQLVKGSPISLLAERDGLVVESFSEPYFDSGCIKSHHDEELSWRFRDPLVAVVYRLASRLPPEIGDLSEDELYVSMQTALSPRFERGFDAFDAFDAVIDAARSARDGGDAVDEASLLASALRLLDEKPAPENAPARPRAADPRLRDAATKLDDWARACGHGREYTLIRASEHSHEDGSVELRLEFRLSSGDDFRVVVEPQVEGRHYLAAGGAYGVGYASDTPPETEARLRLLRQVAKIVAG